MKCGKKALLTLCVLQALGAVCNWGGQASAEETKEGLNSFALDEMVVTANRTEQSIFNANANISVITKNDIERMHYDTLDKALTAVPGVQFQNYGGMDNANMNTAIRINGSKSVLILVDGIRMTPVGSGDSAINLNLINNMDNVERIEVLKGSAGVLYGSDAAGGVINIITKKGGENKTSLKASGGSFGKEAYHFSNSGSDNDVSWHVYYDKDRSGSFEDGHGNERESKFDSHAAGISIDQKIGDKQTFTFKYNESNSNFSGENIEYNPTTLRIGKLYLQETVLRHKWNFDENTSNDLIFRTGRSMGQYKQRSGVYWSAVSPFSSYKTRTISDQFTKKFDDKHTLIAGIDINKTQSGQSAAWGHSDLGDWNIKWANEIKNTSYYIQDTWTFDEKWNLTAGLRYDDAEAENYSDNSSEKRDAGEMDNNLSKSINIAHNFDDKNNVYISYDEYFTIPQADELYNDRYGNIELEPAKGKNYSIGYNKIFDENTSLSVHGFMRKADVSIGLVKINDSPNNEGRYANFKNAKDVGFDIQLNKRFDECWDGFVGYSFLKHTSDEPASKDLVKFGYLPRHSINLGLNYNYDKWNVGLTGYGFLSRDDGEKDSSGTRNFINSHYWIFNVGANYQATKNVKLFASANNIFDTYYAESAINEWGAVDAAYAMPGRSFLLGAEVSF